MLTRLDPAAFRLVVPLCHGLEHHLAVAAILAGDTPADVYVDDRDAPRAALLLPFNRHRVYLAGPADLEEFNRDVAMLLAQRYAASQDQPEGGECVVYYGDQSWDTTIDWIVPQGLTARHQRCYLRLDRPLIAWRDRMPEAYLMRRIDDALLAEAPRNADALIAEIHSESHSVEDFLAHKFGFCIQHDNTLLGWCLSEYNRPGRCEVGIETMPEYRRSGIATLTASALVEHALAAGFAEIGWHCWATNHASANLGRKVGFKDVLEYSVWYCRFHA
jgi:RimJ/RimL family protein N-acetyltransferase